MNEQEIQEIKKSIDKMSQEDCARLHRFAPSGHPIFNKNNGDLYDYFQAHFKKMGGFTPEISKQIGW